MKSQPNVFAHVEVFFKMISIESLKISAKRFIWPAFLVILTVMLGVLAVNSQIVSKEQKQRPKGTFLT